MNDSAESSKPKKRHWFFTSIWVLIIVKIIWFSGTWGNLD